MIDFDLAVLKKIENLQFDVKEPFDNYLSRLLSLLKNILKVDSAFIYLIPDVAQNLNSIEYFIHDQSKMHRFISNSKTLSIDINELRDSADSFIYDPDLIVNIERFFISKKGILIKPIVAHGKYFGGIGVFDIKNIVHLDDNQKNVIEIILMHFVHSLSLSHQKYENAEYLTRIQHINDVYKVALDKSSYILFSDRKGLLTYANEAFLNILKFQSKDIYNEKIDNLILLPNSTIALRDILTLVLNGQIWSGELVLKEDYNLDFWLKSTIIPHKGIDGKVSQVVFVCYDISAQKAATNELLKAKSIAEEAANTKSFFLSNMSHEIRTPLNAIIGIVDIFGEDRLSVEQRRNLSILRNASQNLLAIVNDILDFSKIESNMLDIVQSEFILRESIEEPCLLHSQNAIKNKVQIYCQVDPQIDNLVKGDRTRLEQVISNLVSNAIKFTHNGKVVISVKSNNTKHAGNYLFEVRDTGVGMSSTDITKLFKPFSQIGQDVAKKAKGTGLGLAICNKLVNLMGGEIWIDSIKNEGTSVFFTINFSADRPIAETLSRTSLNLEHKERNAYLCNDIILLEIMHAFDKRLNSNSLVFKDLISLIEWFDFHMSDERINLILDVGCLGDVPIDMIKELTGKYTQIKKVVVLNTTGSKEVEYASKESGFIHLNSSPVLKNEFISAINGQIAKVSFSNTSYDSEEDLNLKILLVDDVEDNRTLVKAYLKKYNCEITEADSGILAIELFKKNQFDVVLMDIQMPEIDGVTATKQIRQYEGKLGLTPVVIVALTAFAQDEERSLFLNAGCNFHLSKPIKKTVLIKSLEGILKSKRVS